MRKPKAIDLFSGCGGLTTGLKQAGFRIVGAIEMDPLAVETYKANHSEVLALQADIRDVRAASFMRKLNLERGELELLAGCPPCQGFSTLRTRNGAKQNRDKNNGLVAEMLRFARAFRPRVVMMENVPGLQTRDAFDKLRSGLEGLGYKTNWDIKNAAQFGVPQRRRRLILVATRRLTVSFPREAKITRTVRDAIGHLGRPGKTGDRLHDLPEQRSARIAKLIKRIPKNGGSRTALPKNRQLQCHRRVDGFRDIYGRMSWNDVAPTITGGCFNPSKGRFLHPSANRAITMREAALLQTFPRRYKFFTGAGKEAIALMIGNALPPEFIRRHALQIAKSLETARRKR